MRRAAALVLLLAGCAGDPPPAGPVTSSAPPPPGGEVLAELPAKGWGTLAGRVTLAGERPKPKPLPVVGQDSQHCPPAVDPTWVVDEKTNGVANAVVWLEPPAGTHFPRQPADRKSWPDEVVVGQPRCQFEPRVVVLFPRVYNAEARRVVPTGQVFRVVNDGEIVHSIKVAGDPARNPEQADVLQPLRPGGRPPAVEFRQLQPDKSPLSLRCGLHPWMSGYARAFDHPHAAVTGPDGRFEIKNAPAGVELTLRAWHESGRPVKPPAGGKVTLAADGTTTADFTVSP